MAIFTLTEVEEKLTQWKAALTAVSKGQEYSYEGRRLTRVDVGEIIKTLKLLDAERSKLKAIAEGRPTGLQRAAFRPVR